MSPVEEAAEADEGLWIADCFECDWQVSDRDWWRADNRAGAHYLETGHVSKLTLEDR